MPMLAEMSNQQLIEMGNKEIAETDKALERARQVVEDTIQIGAQVRSGTPGLLQLRAFRLLCASCQPLWQAGALLSAAPQAPCTIATDANVGMVCPQQTAATLNDQTKQMEGILNDLDDITFNMKKAQKVIGDITRGLATDKYVTAGPHRHCFAAPGTGSTRVP